MQDPGDKRILDQIHRDAFATIADRNAGREREAPSDRVERPMQRVLRQPRRK